MYIYIYIYIHHMNYTFGIFVLFPGRTSDLGGAGDLTTNTWVALLV